MRQPVATSALAAALLACGDRTGLEVAPPTPGTAQDAAPTGAGPRDASTCPDGGPLEIAYALDGAGVLYRYDAMSGRSLALGAPNCGNGNVPWTVTASPEKAYVVYTDWTLYAVDLATLACTPTPFQAGQLGIEAEFGVAVTGRGASERFYVYGLPSPGGGTPVLAVSDTTSFQLSLVGPITPAPPPETFPVNLTSDAYGHLYAFSPLGFVQEIDPASGAVLASADTGVTTQGTWATLTYGPNLFLWVDTDVVGYDLAARAQTGSIDAGVAAIGAGSFLACP